MSMLRTQSLVKRYGGLTVTDSVSLNIVAGELHALIGPNGSGKTTLVESASLTNRQNSMALLILVSLPDAS